MSTLNKFNKQREIGLLRASGEVVVLYSFPSPGEAREFVREVRAESPETETELGQYGVEHLVIVRTAA